MKKRIYIKQYSYLKILFSFVFYVHAIFFLNVFKPNTSVPSPDNAQQRYAVSWKYSKRNCDLHIGTGNATLSSI